MSSNMLGQAHNDLYAFLKYLYAARSRSGVSCLEEKYFDWPYAQVFVARNIKVLYCPIAKNACSSLKRLMVELSDIDGKEVLLGGDIHTATDRQFTGIQLKDLAADEVCQALESDEYLRFAVLREPLSRLLSAYWDKFVITREHPAILGDTLPVLDDIAKRRGQGKIDPHVGITFREFVEHVTSHDPHLLNAHWRPQFTYLEGINYNACYDIERLDALVGELARRSGQVVGLSSLNVTNSGQGQFVEGAMSLLPSQLQQQGAVSIDSFFDQALEARVRDYFARDFELLQSCQ